MTTELVIITILITSILYQYYKINNLLDQQKDIINKSNELEENIRKENQINHLSETEKEHRNNLYQRDRKVVDDIFTPGERRLPAHQYPKSEFKKSINISTQGVPENYQYVGNIIRDTDDKILPVFGRQEYPGSDYYEYYLVLNQDGNFGLKLPLNNGKRRREIQDEEIVELNYFKSEPGNFVFHQFDYDVPRYNPYII